MDLNQLLHRHQLSLMQLDEAESPDERRAHQQFACDYAEKIQTARDELNAPAPPRQFLADIGVAHECSTNEHERMAMVTARVVLTSSGDLPYKVVVSRNSEECAGHLFGTMREAEAFARWNTPAPAPRSELYDRQSGQALSEVFRPTGTKWISDAEET